MKRLRLMEWASATILTFIGLNMVVFPEWYTRPGLSVFTSYSNIWAGVVVTAGVMRLVALYINGHWTRGTPTIRLIGCMVGASIFGALAGNVLSNYLDDPTPNGFSWAVTTYAVLMTYELINSYHAAKDIAKYKLMRG